MEYIVLFVLVFNVLIVLLCTVGVAWYKQHIDPERELELVAGWQPTDPDVFGEGTWQAILQATLNRQGPAVGRDNPRRRCVNWKREGF